MAVTWKSFLLRPAPHQRPLEEFRAYTQNWTRPAEQPDSGEFTLWTGDNAPPTHSVPALVAAKVAASFGPEAFHAFHWRALAAYFTENQTISDLDVLSTVAAEAGLDASAFRRRLDERWPELEAEVFAEHAEAIELGIDGVPATVVDGRFLISGAQPVAAFRNVIDRALRERVEASRSA